MPAALRAHYDALRDRFAETGSPALPDGLNLGAQLFRLETLFPGLLEGGGTILPWAQYWSWLLCGVAASEITSLGCHTDLWRPLEGVPSHLAEERGWAAHFAPLARAGEVLGRLTPVWIARTGLRADVEVHCGLHDSNAALLAARASGGDSSPESTMVSTGTWFVAMRSARKGACPDMSSLAEDRDCLVNVDPFGTPVPSARFMGGREIETLLGPAAGRIDVEPDRSELVAAASSAVAGGAMALPSFAPGSGPFADARGRWIATPADDRVRRAAVLLYAALVADVSLGLIGARERILVQGRFAEADLFVRALATLRPDDAVHVGDAGDDVSFGALRLLMPDLPARAIPTRVAPLGIALGSYREAWHHEAGRTVPAQ